MINLIRQRDLYGTALSFLIVVLIGFQEMISPAIGIFIVVVLIEGFYFKSLRFQMNVNLFLWVGLFLFYMIGLIWSEHPEVGWKLLEYKMSFFIFPIIFLFRKDKSHATLCLDGLIFGSTLLAVRILYIHFFEEAELPFFEIARQHIDLHPSYVAIYFSLTIVYLFQDILIKTKGIRIFMNGVLIVLLAWIVLKLGSFAGILFLMVLFALGAGVILFKILPKWIALVLLIGIAFSAYKATQSLPSLQYDLEMISVVRNDLSKGKEYFFQTHQNSPYGTINRVSIWLLAAEIIQENPWGVGTGDIDYYITQKCDKYELHALKELNINPHNQFLQIGIDLGYPGILYLIFMMLWILKEGFKVRNYFLVISVICLLFNAMFESVLQRQSGIVFFTLILCIGMTYPLIKKRTTL
jgi:O-antigen ligase